jgi:hypothetical protein
VTIFPRDKRSVFILTKNGLGYSLGEFSSGRPVPFPSWSLKEGLASAAAIISLF